MIIVLNKVDMIPEASRAEKLAKLQARHATLRCVATAPHASPLAPHALPLAPCTVHLAPCAVHTVHLAPSRRASATHSAPNPNPSLDPNQARIRKTLGATKFASAPMVAVAASNPDPNPNPNLNPSPSPSPNPNPNPRPNPNPNPKPKPKPAPTPIPSLTLSQA